METRQEQYGGSQERLSGCCSGSKLLMMTVVLAVTVGLFVGRFENLSPHVNALTASPSSPTAISNTSSLASIAWDDTNGIMQHRVYWLVV